MIWAPSHTIVRSSRQKQKQRTREGQSRPGGPDVGVYLGNWTGLGSSKLMFSALCVLTVRLALDPFKHP